MDELGLFSAALGLNGPWRVTRSEFDAEAAQLDPSLDCDRGARFVCPATDCAHPSCPVHDSGEKDLAASGFLPAQGVLACPGAPGALPRVWGEGRSACPGLAPGQGSRCCSKRSCSASPPRCRSPRSRR
jgi:hypothetical protein